MFAPHHVVAWDMRLISRRQAVQAISMYYNDPHRDQSFALLDFLGAVDSFTPCVLCACKESMITFSKVSVGASHLRVKPAICLDTQSQYELLRNYRRPESLYSIYCTGIDIKTVFTLKDLVNLTLEYQAVPIWLAYWSVILTARLYTEPCKFRYESEQLWGECIPSNVSSSSCHQLK